MLTRPLKEVFAMNRLIRRIMQYIQSPSGQRRLQDARRHLDTPDNRRRLEQLRRRLRRRR